MLIVRMVLGAGCCWTLLKSTNAITKNEMNSRSFSLHELMDIVNIIVLRLAEEQWTYEWNDKRKQKKNAT